MSAAADAAAMAAIAGVLATYFDGLHHSDTARLRTAFHPLAHYASAAGGTLLHLGMEDYFAMVDRRPSPASRGEARADRIIAIELAGPVTAFARVECAIGPRHFTDFLTLIRVEDCWRIIAKVFDATRRGPDPERRPG